MKNSIGVYLVFGLQIIFLSNVYGGELFLFSDEELQTLNFTEEQWVDELYQYRIDKQLREKMVRNNTRSPDGSLSSSGPVVSVRNPTLNGDYYRSPIPLQLLVFLKSRQAPINIDSLDIKGKRGFFTLNITDRITPFLRKPAPGEDADYVIDAKIPKIGEGRYLIIMTLADIEGNTQEHSAFLEVVKN